MGREVLTLQFGSFANYVGAHYWNFQDELLGLQESEDPATAAAAAQVDAGTLYRTGETPGGSPTYTPRLVLFDLSGSLGGTSGRGSLYVEEEPALVSSWQGRREVHRAAPVPKSSFALQLEEEAVEGEPAGQPAGPGGGEDERPDQLAAAARALDTAGGVRYFTDYLKAHLHPRSICQLAGVWQGTVPFDGWGDGAAYAASAERRDDMAERVRFFAEEADSLQGVQVFVDDLSGFGGLAAALLPELREDLGASLPVALFAVRPAAAAAPGAEPAVVRRRRLGEGLSAALLSQACSTYTPLAPPLAAALPVLTWQAAQPYHTAAICAAALDTATLPYRLAGGDGSAAGMGRLDMWSLSQLLTSQHSTPLTALALAMPCPALPADLAAQAQQADARLEHQQEAPSPSQQQQPFTLRHSASLTPGIASRADPQRYVESVVLRGPRSEAQAPVALAAASAALDAALAAERQRCVRQRSLSSQALPLPLPFPHLFGRRVSAAGDVCAAGGGGGAPPGGVVSCSVLTRLSGTTAFEPALEQLRSQFHAAAGAAQGQAVMEGWGYGREEGAEVEERLRALAGAYEED